MKFLLYLIGCILVGLGLAIGFPYGLIGIIGLALATLFSPLNLY